MSYDLQAYPREVWHEDDPLTKFRVAGLCRNCQRVDMGQWMRPWVFNTQTRKMHFAGDAEYTLCGIKADDWQWIWQL